MADDGIHEIQLNGKQLVFLFMAVTVVAVVIFLCGVMVGRGVRVPRAGEPAEVSAAASVDPTAQTQSPTPAPSATAPTEGTPPVVAETLTYAERLEDSGPAPERLRESSDTAPAPTPPPPAPEPPSPSTRNGVSRTSAAAAPATEPAASAPAMPEPAGSGFVVQVAAVRARAEAETIARRLAAKGYPSFVTTPGTGAANVFRVRVGKYPDRREAETVAGRLEKEEQFKPWITR
jgi:cell division septation protein DedD